MENTFQNILNFKDIHLILKQPPKMNRLEQESSYKIFLKKLLEFTKRITPYKKDRTAMRLYLNEIHQLSRQHFASCRMQCPKLISKFKFDVKTQPFGII
jgi:hypothetical protein